MALKMHNETKPKTTASRSWGGRGIPTTKAAAKPKPRPVEAADADSPATPPAAPAAGDAPAR